MNKLNALMAQIAKERTRLKPVPRRGIGRILPSEPIVIDDLGGGAPPVIASTSLSPPQRWDPQTLKPLPVTEYEILKDWPTEAEPQHETRIGAGPLSMDTFKRPSLGFAITEYEDLPDGSGS